MTEPNGLLVLDKPPGPTSHDVVARVRRTLGLRRVGHAGTLDPPATGVLLVGVGRSTRLLRYLQGLDKAYDGELVFGVETTTLDAAGPVTKTTDPSALSDAAIQAAVASLRGAQRQLPPMVSAVHHGGRRLHELAREGTTVERVPRDVVVQRFEVERVVGPRFRFEVRCTSGTYVRALVADLGEALSVGAHVAVLRRVAVGEFGLDDALAPSCLEDAAALSEGLLAPAAAVAHLASLRLDDAATEDVAHGRAIPAPPGTTGRVALVDPQGSLVAVAVAAGSVLRPEVVLQPGGVRGDG